MIAAIYARKSTSQERASEEARSTSRQVELGRAFAAQQGWSVADENVFIDEAISGGEIAKRPGLQALLRAAGSQPRRFDILVVMNQSRLARRMRYAVDVVHDLHDAGVRLFSYQTGMEVKLDSATNRFLVGVTGFADEQYRESVQVTTRETMRQKVRRGEAGGGRVLGYRNVGEPGSRCREIDPEQAALVRRIFTMAAEGKGLLRIAKTLNAQGIKNPTGQDRGKPTKRSEHWSATGIRAVLHRRLYLGEVVYGRTRWEDRGESKVKVRVLDESQWVRRTDESLRIVDQDLWQRAHARMAATHAVYLRRANGKLVGRPASGLESKHLLAGHLQCGVCGGNLVFSAKWGDRGRVVKLYTCATRRTRGKAACSAKHGVPAEPLTLAVLAQLRDALAWSVVADRLAAVVEAPARHQAERSAVAASLAALDAELQRGAELLLTGKAPTALLDAIRRRESERRDLQGKLERLDGLSFRLPDFTSEAGWAAWEADLAPLLADLRATLQGDPAKARQRLREVLKGPIVVTPVEGGWTFRGWTSFEAIRLDLTTGQTAGMTVVSRPLAGSIGAGHNKWCPRGDSNTRHAV